MRIAVVTLSTADYFPGTKKLFTSLKLKSKLDDVACILFSNEPHAKNYFGALFDEIVSLPPVPSGIPASLVVPRFVVTLHKLYALAFLEGSNFDRVIFLDSDIMCLASIDFLFDSELNQHHFLAARDFACYKYYPLEISTIGLDPLRIFNSGCFILNRSILNVLNYKNLISAISTTAKSYDGGDQGYLNFIVQNSDIIFGELPIRFNYPLDTNYPLLWWPPTLVHFSGEKPWNVQSQIPSWDRAIYKLYNLGDRTWGGQIGIPIVYFWYLRNIHMYLHHTLYRFFLHFKFLISKT
jgi:Glycosyl transferase family 8